MIVSLHVASGAALGALSGSRTRALLLGPPAHMLGDRVPHEDIASRNFEIGSGVVCLALLAARRHQDFADVVSLIRIHNLDEDLLKRLHSSLHQDFIECLEEKRREDEYESRQ